MLRAKIAHSYSECETLCREIIKSPHRVIGFDTETTVVKYKKYPVSIIQICIEGNHGGDSIIESNKNHTSYIFRIANIWERCGCLPSALKLLLSRHFMKVGCDVKRDFKQLYEGYRLKSYNYEDLQDIARRKKIPGISLDHLSFRYIGIEKDYTERVGIWHKNLSDEQVKYASIDSYLSLRVYECMIKTEIEIGRYPPPNKDDISNYYNFLKFKNINHRSLDDIIVLTSICYGEWKKKYTLGEITQYSVFCINEFINKNMLKENDEGLLTIIRKRKFVDNNEDDRPAKRIKTK